MIIALSIVSTLFVLLLIGACVSEDEKPTTEDRLKYLERQAQFNEDFQIAIIKHFNLKIELHDDDGITIEDSMNNGKEGQ